MYKNVVYPSLMYKNVVYPCLIQFSCYCYILFFTIKYISFLSVDFNEWLMKINKSIKFLDDILKKDFF